MSLKPGLPTSTRNSCANVPQRPYFSDERHSWPSRLKNAGGWTNLLILQALGTLSCIALVVILRFRGDTISDTLDGHSREACLEKFWDFFSCFLWIFRWIWQSHGDNKMQQQQARKMMNTQCIQKLWPLTRLAHTTMSYTSKSTATYSTLLAGQSIHMICYTYIVHIVYIYIIYTLHQLCRS